MLKKQAMKMTAYFAAETAPLGDQSSGCIFCARRYKKGVFFDLISELDMDR
jgi:hypothetical protein